MSSREKPRAGLGQVVGPEREEVGMVGDAVCRHAGARQLDHRADLEVAPELQSLVVPGGHDQLAHELELALVVDERDHHLEPGRRPLRSRTATPAREIACVCIS